jgi:hypothetical protein
MRFSRRSWIEYWQLSVLPVRKRYGRILKVADIAAQNSPRASARTKREIAQRGEVQMRTCIFAILIAGWLTTATGCLIPLYSADPARRAQQLIFTSEDLRAMLDEWERIWFLDQPSHLKPIRTHGGII